MERYEELYVTLNMELQPALGCTEPAEKTIRNLGILDRDGMRNADQVILKLMPGRYA